MQQITELSADAKQTLRMQIEDGEIATFTFEYVDNQIGWYMSLEYDRFTINNLRLTNNPNLLSAFQNLIRFGLRIDVSDGAEPYFLTDFTSGRVQVYVLNKAEVDYVENILYSRE